MAYPNGYFPTFYQPQVQVPQPIPQQISQQQMMAPQQPQIQSGGFLSVPNEDIAINYPVAPGNCVTFKIEGKPIVMEKSMGFSQLESPRVEKYRLVKEEPAPNPTPVQTPARDFGAELDRIWGEIDALKRITGKKEEPNDADTDA